LLLVRQRGTFPMDVGSVPHFGVWGCSKLLLAVCPMWGVIFFVGLGLFQIIVDNVPHLGGRFCCWFGVVPSCLVVCHFCGIILGVGLELFPVDVGGVPRLGGMGFGVGH